MRRPAHETISRTDSAGTQLHQYRIPLEISLHEPLPEPIGNYWLRVKCAPEVPPVPGGETPSVVEVVALEGRPPWRHVCAVGAAPGECRLEFEMDLSYEARVHVKLLQDGSCEPETVTVELEPKAKTLLYTLALHVTQDLDPVPEPDTELALSCGLSREYRPALNLLVRARVGDLPALIEQKVRLEPGDYFMVVEDIGNAAFAVLKLVALPDGTIDDGLPSHKSELHVDLLPLEDADRRTRVVRGARDPAPYRVPLEVSLEEPLPAPLGHHTLSVECIPAEGVSTEGVPEREFLPYEGEISGTSPWTCEATVVRNPGRHTLVVELNDTYIAEAEVDLLPGGWFEPERVSVQLRPEHGTHVYALRFEVSAPTASAAERDGVGTLVCKIGRLGSPFPMAFEKELRPSGLPAVLEQQVRLLPGAHIVLTKDEKSGLAETASFAALPDGTVDPPTVRIALMKEKNDAEGGPAKVGGYKDAVQFLLDLLDAAAKAENPDELAVPLVMLSFFCGPCENAQLPAEAKAMAWDMLRTRLPLLRKAFGSHSEMAKMYAAMMLIGLGEVDDQTGWAAVLGFDQAATDITGEVAWEALARKALRGLESDLPHERLRALLFCTMTVKSEDGTMKETLWQRLRSDDPAVRSAAVEEINRLAGRELDFEPEDLDRWAEERQAQFDAIMSRTRREAASGGQ